MSNNVKFLGEVSAVGRIHSDAQIDAPVVNASDTISATTLQATADVKINGASVRDAISELSTNKADKSTTLEGYGIEDAYTKEETLNLLKEKPDKATTLEGYGITDAYTKTEVDSKLNEKVNSATTLSGYGITDAYTKEQTYNRTQIDDLLVEGGFQGDWQADKGEPGYIQNKPDLVNFETESISTPNGGIYIDDEGVSVTQNYDVNESSYIHTTSTVTHTGFHLDYLRENEDSGTVAHSYIDLGWAEKTLTDTSGSPGITVRNHDGSQFIRITDTDILKNGVSIIPKTKYLYLLSHSDVNQEWTRIINLFYLSDTKITTATVSTKDLVYGIYPVWGYEMYGRSGEALEFTLYKSIEIKRDSLVLDMIQHDKQSSTSTIITQLIFSVTSYGKTIV